MRKLLFINLFILCLSLPIIVLAQEPGNITFSPNVPIGQISGPIQVSDDLLGIYINTWYGFVVGTVGIMATIIIMYAGFKWLASRGNAGVIQNSKEKIWSAIIGLLLAFGSYIILQTINSQFLNLSLTGLSSSNIQFVEPQGRDFEPAYSGSTPTNHPQQGANTETLNGMNIAIKDGVRVDHLHPTVVTTAENIRNNFDGDLTITSAYRPNSDGSQHQVGRALDFRRTPEFDQFMRDEVIRDAEPAFYYEGQPGYIVNYQGQNIRVIDEPNNNCWHIDTKLIQ